jgi:hypothetical protein
MTITRIMAVLRRLSCLAILIFAGATSLPAQDVRPPQGLLEEPRLGGFNIDPLDPRDRAAATAANLDTEFTLSGWVDFPPGEGELWIYVGCDGDSYPGNGEFRVRVAQPSDATRTIDTRTVWNFSIGPFKPFREAFTLAEESGGWCGKPWQDGGTARVSLYAYRYSDGEASQLTYLDRDGVPVENSHNLIFADHNATPLTQFGYVQLIGGVIPFPAPLYFPPAVLGKKNQTGTPEETKAYYQSVFVDPEGKGPHQTIWNKLRRLKDFKQRYFPAPSLYPGPQSENQAVYFNRGDLGIGRWMHCTYKPDTQETACYVENYGKRVGEDGQAFFTTDKSFSYDAIQSFGRAFATVAMVSRGLMPAGAPNKVFFAVYTHQGRYNRSTLTSVTKDNSPLALEAPLDNVGYNKFIPGNCLVCHGAQARYDKATRQVFLAQFLPFDLQHSFEFYSDDPSHSFSRASQELSFLLLNRLIARTELYALPEARALLNGFYGAPAYEVDPNAWPSRSFQNDFVPDGWNVNDDSRQIYKKVIAPYCRTCHISHSTLHFGNWDNFSAFQHQIREAMCKARDANIMPNAEATLNAFWRSDARAQWVSRMNAPGCGLEPYE